MRRRAEGEAVGVGLAMFIEKAGLGPADGVKIAVKPSGHVEVITGGDAEETRKWVEAAGGNGSWTIPIRPLPGTLGRESKPSRKLVEHFSERRTKALADIKKMIGETKAVAPELAKMGK